MPITFNEMVPVLKFKPTFNCLQNLLGMISTTPVSVIYVSTILSLVHQFPASYIVDYPCLSQFFCRPLSRFIIALLIQIAISDVLPQTKCLMPSHLPCQV